MKKVLIIDAGSTKMEWTLMENGNATQRLITKGYNPNYADPQTLTDIIKEVDILKETICDVYYYGSGCFRMENAALVGQILQCAFINAIIHVTNDLMGAAHAILGCEKGIVCILGTGANSCFYNGERITDRAVSLGYLVGDEGSGCYIGRKLARAYFYDLMPLKVKLAFKEDFQLEISDFIENVYHQPEASKYLANFTLFADKHQEDPFIRQLVKECFKDFIQVFVLRYELCHSVPIGFVGSVAYHFKGLLKECLEEQGLAMGEVMQSPMEGLIRYYHVD